VGSLIIIAAMFALLWLLLIRPQRQKQLQHQRMIESVEEGDEILMTGGIFGVVNYIDEEENELHVEIAKDVVVRVDRRAVGQVFGADEDDDAAAEDDDAAGETLEAGDAALEESGPRAEAEEAVDEGPHGTMRADPTATERR
jgi:preprotein translocase subunit YajC